MIYILLCITFCTMSRFW